MFYSLIASYYCHIFNLTGSKYRLLFNTNTVLKKKSHFVDKVIYFICITKKIPVNTRLYRKSTEQCRRLQNLIILILSFGLVILNSLILEDVLTLPFDPEEQMKISM